MRPALRLRGRARYPTSPKPLWWEAGAARAPHELIFWSTVRWSSVDVLHYRPQSANSHDEEDGEGAHLSIIGVNNFNKIVSGGNIYIKTN